MVTILRYHHIHLPIPLSSIQERLVRTLTLRPVVIQGTLDMRLFLVLVMVLQELLPVIIHKCTPLSTPATLAIHRVMLLLLVT
jgi:hypothetical protein